MLTSTTEDFRKNNSGVFYQNRYLAQSRYNRGCFRPIFDMDFQFLAIGAAQGITEKKNWTDYEQLLRAAVSCFQHGRWKDHNYFLLLLCKSSIWFTEKHIFKIIICFFQYIKMCLKLCHFIWIIWLFFLLIGKSIIWFTEKHIFKIIICFFNTLNVPQIMTMSFNLRYMMVS